MDRQKHAHPLRKAPFSWLLAMLVAIIFVLALILCLTLVRALRVAPPPEGSEATSAPTIPASSTATSTVLPEETELLPVTVETVSAPQNRADDLDRVLYFEPDESYEILDSPGMGLAPWADSAATLELPTRLVYVKLTWSEWEPTDDMFDVEYVRTNFHLDQYRAEGRQVVFRFICDDPSQTKELNIPQWLYDKMEGDGDWYDTSYGSGFSPNYSNPIMIEEHAEAVRALGEAFGQDSFFLYVQMGSLGHWGEYHTKHSDGIRRMPPYSIRKQYIDPYVEAFPHAQLMLRYPLIDAEEYQMGLYNDMTGDTEATDYWFNSKDGGVWEESGEREAIDGRDIWMEHPIGGEFASSYPDSYFMDEAFSETLNNLVRSHQSFIGPKVIIDEKGTDYDTQMETILTTIGYRYYVPSVILDFNGEDTFTIEFSVCNLGIAPIYMDTLVTLSIYDTEGDPVGHIDLDALDLHSLLPEDEQTLCVTVPTALLQEGKEYELLLSAHATESGMAIPFALEDVTQDGLYRIATFSGDE